MDRVQASKENSSVLYTMDLYDRTTAAAVDVRNWLG